MPRLQLVRARRQFGLVGAGVLIGALLVAPATARVAADGPAALQTRATSCQGLAFHPIDSATGYKYAGAVLLRDPKPPVGGSGFFVCDPHLPDKAVVTKVQFTLQDTSSLAELRYCGLDRSPLAAADAQNLQGVAEVPPTGMAETPGIVRKTATAISHAVVDASAWAYWLQCQVAYSNHGSGGPAGILGADVIYQISPANG